MENKYELFITIDQLTKDVYEKSFKSKGYEIIYNDDDILFVKKLNSKDINEKKEKIILEVIISMAKKYKANGIVHIDFSNEVNSILDEIKDVETVKGFDNRITWPIRQVFIKAIIEKNKIK